MRLSRKISKINLPIFLLLFVVKPRWCRKEKQGENLKKQLKNHQNLINFRWYEIH